MSYTTWLRWGILAGIFLVPFIPFIIATGASFPNMFFPYITGKNFAFRIIVEIIAALYLILALRDPQYRPKGSWLMWTALAFVAWMAIATLFSVDPAKSFWSNFERMEGYIGLVHMFAWFVVMGAMLSAQNLWTRFMNTSIAVSAIMGVYALLQVTNLLGFEPSSQSGARADTSFGNATYLAVYLLIHIFLTLFMLARSRRTAGLQVAYGLALVFQLMGLYFTETRGAILGLIGGLIITAIWLAWRAKAPELKSLRRTAIGGLVAIVIIVGGFIALRNSSFLQQSGTLGRLANISLEDRTTQSRFQIWGIAFEGIKERPVTGWGQENFSFVFNKYYDPAMYEQEAWFDRAHNQFIDWFIAGGLPAGLLYFLLYALAAWAIIRTHKLSVTEQAILLGLFGGFAFNNLFVFDNLLSAVFFFALLAFVHSLVRKELPSTMALTKPMGEHGLAVAAPVIALVFLVGAWAINGPAMARARTLVNAVQTQTAEGGRNPAENLAEFKQVFSPAWPGTGLGRQESAEQLMQYASQVAAASGVDPAVRTEILTLSATTMEALLKDRPNDARLELFYGTFLASAGQQGPALEHLRAALAASPKKQQVLFQLGLTTLQTGDINAALGHFKAAFDLAPGYATARVLYAAGYYYAGEMAKGDALLNEGFGTTIVDNDQLLSVYIDTKQLDRAAAIWEKRIAREPKNNNYYLGLAQMYFTSGNNPKTIETLERLAVVDPTQAAQVAQIITQIKNGTLKP